MTFQKTVALIFAVYLIILFIFSVHTTGPENPYGLMSIVSFGLVHFYLPGKYSKSGTHTFQWLFLPIITLMIFMFVIMQGHIGIVHQQKIKKAVAQEFESTFAILNHTQILLDGHQLSYENAEYYASHYEDSAEFSKEFRDLSGSSSQHNVVSLQYELYALLVSQGVHFERQQNLELEELFSDIATELMNIEREYIDSVEDVYFLKRHIGQTLEKANKALAKLAPYSDFTLLNEVSENITKLNGLQVSEILLSSDKDMKSKELQALEDLNIDSQQYSISRMNFQLPTIPKMNLSSVYFDVVKNHFVQLLFHYFALLMFIGFSFYRSIY